MSPTLVVVLTLISGISWTIVYIDLIRRGFKDKTYGMPLFALAFNIAWEFIFGFLVGGEVSLQKVVNAVWFLFDAVIVYTYFKYGRKDFPKTADRFLSPGVWRQLRSPSSPFISRTLNSKTFGERVIRRLPRTC